MSGEGVDMSQTRRDFLMAAGLSAGAVWSGGCGSLRQAGLARRKRSGDRLNVAVNARAATDGVMVVDVSLAEKVVWSAAPRAVKAGTSLASDLVIGGPSSPGVDIVLPEGGTTVEVTVGVGADEAKARAAPAVKYRFFVDRHGAGVRALQPGRYYRPDHYGLRVKHELRWIDDIDRGDLLVKLDG